VLLRRVEGVPTVQEERNNETGAVRREIEIMVPVRTVRHRSEGESVKGEQTLF
jgi:hypothetical protein